MNVDVIDETETLSDVQLEWVEKLLQFSSDYIQLPKNEECSVTFVNNERIQTINRDYRQKDMPTDVISFALDDEVAGELVPHLSGFEDMPHHLGDIIVSLEKCQEQASAYNHSFERELGFLIVHGFLHLNGYDHLTKEDETEMFSLQHDILEAFGLRRDSNVSNA